MSNLEEKKQSVYIWRMANRDLVEGMLCHVDDRDLSIVYSTMLVTSCQNLTSCVYTSCVQLQTRYGVSGRDVVCLVETWLCGDIANNESHYIVLTAVNIVFVLEELESGVRRNNMLLLHG